MDEHGVGLGLGVVLLVGLMGVSCAPGEDPSVPELRNVVEQMFEAGWNQGDLEVFSETVADSVRFHYAGSLRETTRQEMTEMVVRWRQSFPDLRMAIEDFVGEGDKAAVRLTLSGTHEGEWLGAAPTGERVEMAVMMFLRFEDGKLVELWEVDDQLGFRRQLGILR